MTSLPGQFPGQCIPVCSSGMVVTTTTSSPPTSPTSTMHWTCYHSTCWMQGHLCRVMYAWSSMHAHLCMVVYAWSFMHSHLCMVVYARSFVNGHLVHNSPCKNIYMRSFVHVIYAWLFMHGDGRLAWQADSQQLVAGEREQALFTACP